SGFLIGRQLQRELQRSDTVNVPRFLFRRGMRIWPLYFAWVTFLALALGKWHGIWPDLTFLSNYVQGQVSGGWSLSTEEQFYLVVPLLLLGVQRTFGPRGQAWVPLVLLALMPVVRAVTLHGSGEAGLEQIYGPIHTHCDALPRAPASVALAPGRHRRRIRAPGDRRSAVQLQRARAGLRRDGGAGAQGRAAGPTAHRLARVSHPLEAVVRDVPQSLRGAPQTAAPADACAGADRRVGVAAGGGGVPRGGPELRAGRRRHLHPDRGAVPCAPGQVGCEAPAGEGGSGAATGELSDRSGDG